VEGFFHINQISEAFCTTKIKDEIVLQAKRVKFILMKNNLRVKQYKCKEAVLQKGNYCEERIKNKSKQ
jgi:hypothetical protein